MGIIVLFLDQPINSTPEETRDRAGDETGPDGVSQTSFATAQISQHAAGEEQNPGGSPPASPVGDFRGIFHATSCGRSSLYSISLYNKMPGQPRGLGQRGPPRRSKKPNRTCPGVPVPKGHLVNGSTGQLIWSLAATPRLRTSSAMRGRPRDPERGRRWTRRHRPHDALRRGKPSPR